MNINHGSKLGPQFTKAGHVQQSAMLHGCSTHPAVEAFPPPAVFVGMAVLFKMFPLAADGTSIGQFMLKKKTWVDHVRGHT